MHWTYLGHAGWLVEAEEIRLLFDPLVNETHYGGVFETAPRRQLSVRALQADFVFLSHAHPDHFDVESLVQLAGADPDTVVISPDPWVLHVAAQAGFRVTQRLDAGQRIDLQGVQVVATPSQATDPECGFLVATEHACVWDLVDCVFADPAQVQDVAKQCATAAGQRGIDLALVRWQPLKEVAAALGLSHAFPFQEYSNLLHEAVATGASTLMGSSAGARHSGLYEHMNALVYPLRAERFARDLAQLAPHRNVLTPRLGDCFHVQDGSVTLATSRAEVLAHVQPDAPPAFHPTEFPALVPSRADTADLLTEIEAWVSDQLLPGLTKQGSAQHLFLVLEVLTCAGPHCIGIEVGPFGARRCSRDTVDFDLLNQTTAGALLEVLRGHASWGELLLSARLRVVNRAYHVGTSLERSNLLPTFVYFGLPYAESERKATLHRLTRALSRRDA